MIKYRDILAETERIIVRPVLITDFDVFVSGYKNCGSSRNRFDEGCFDTGHQRGAKVKKFLRYREGSEISNYCSRYFFGVMPTVFLKTF